MSNNGGSAFPYSALSPEGPEVYKDSEGMTLRDYFAGKALGLGGEFFHVYSGGYHNPEIIAQTVYKIADAMLTERKK